MWLQEYKAEGRLWLYPQKDPGLTTDRVIYPGEREWGPQTHWCLGNPRHPVVATNSPQAGGKEMRW